MRVRRARRQPLATRSLLDKRRALRRPWTVRLPNPTDRLAAGRRWVPYVVAAVMLVLGYLHYAPGAHYSLSERHYRDYAFPAFRYSDLIWLYLRDDLARQPIPYLEYPLEYPSLTGIVSYLLSFAPDLPAYFALAYLLLAVSALGTIWVLSRLPGANPWLFAAAPALFFYTGHQWDGLAILVTSLALLAFSRGQDRWGALALAAAVSLKLFPLVFVAAVVIERLRQRRFRAAVEIGALFALGTAAVNLPFALANRDGWSFFYRWNRDRLADSGIWVLWRGLSTEQLTAMSLVTAMVGGLAITALALRARGPLLLPLGASYLLWWLFVNKTFTTHLVLWVFLAVALLGVPWWLWGSVVAVDLVGFQLGNFLNLYNVADFQYAPLIRKAVEYLYDPLQLARSAVLLVAVAWGARRLARGPTPRSAVGATTASSQIGEATLASPIVAGGRSGEATNGRPLAIPHHELAAGPAAPYPSRRRRWLLAGAVAAVYAATTVVMTWPYALHLRDATVVGFDPLLQIWLSGWIRHALVTDPRHLYDANIFHPFAQTLAYTDANLPGALLAAPLDLLTGDPILTNSLLVLATFVLAAGGIYTLVVDVTGNRAAGFVAGLAYAFLPYRMVHLWHLNWLQGAWLPWLFLALLRLIRQPTRGRALVLGGLIAVQTLTSFYFALQIGILAGLTLAAALIADRRLRTRRLAAALALAGGVAVAIAGPLYLPYLQVRHEQGLERTIADAEQYKATAASYLKLAPWDEPTPLWGGLGPRPGVNESLTTVGQERHADGHHHAEIVIEDALYPGAIATISAAVGLAGTLWVWRRRRWLPVALGLTTIVAVVLSLGPSWGAGDGTGPPLPYRFLFDHVPFFTAMRVPARLGGLASFAIVVLLGLGIAQTWRWLAAWRVVRPGRRRRALAAALTAGLALLVLFELYAAPIPLEAVDRGPDVAAPYEWLATQPAGPVMEFPAESIFADPAAGSVRRHVGLMMFWSTQHWQPLVNGSSGFIPRAHSELIEAFVGDIPRPDGSVAQRISHVNADTVALVQQLGVRYLVFHRSQYRPEDWAAVVAQLETVEGVLEPVGDVGEATIYRVRATASPPRPPSLTLFAPTLLTPETAWAPLLAIAKPAGQPALLSLTRVARMSLTWYDDQGRRLRRDETRLPLPVVVTAEQVLCTVDDCDVAAGDDFPDDLPDPLPGLWRPTEPGHYAVRVEITGDRPLDCKVDLDLVEDDDEVIALSPDSPYRWAECVAAGRHPVNNPGALPFRSPSPSVTFVGGQVALEATLITRRDEEIQAWFLLAPPGTPVPWQDVRYRSTVRQRLVRANEPADFDWLEQLSAEVPPGVYGLTIWFHRRTDDGWEHAYGGGFRLAPVVIAADGSARWAGPIRLTRNDRLPAFAVGRTSTLRLEVAGDSATTRCDAAWRLLTPGDGAVVADGHAGSCERPRISLPGSVPPGRYQLELTADAIRGERRQLSDGLSMTITVTDGTRSGTPR